MLFLRAVLVIISAISSGVAAGYGAVAPHKMTIAYASIGPRSAPLWAADEFGIFRKYGIEPQVIFVRGAPTLVAALTSGDMDIGYTGGTAVLGASVAGIDLKILAVLTNRVTYDVVARPGIKSAEDLRGKRFGVTSIGGTLWMGGVLGLEKLGLFPETQAELETIITQPHGIILTTGPTGSGKNPLWSRYRGKTSKKDCTWFYGTRQHQHSASK